MVTYNMPLPPSTPAGSRAPARRATPAPQKPQKKSGVNITPILLLVVVIGLGIGIYFFVQSRTGSTAGVDSGKFTRELTARVEPPDSAKIFNRSAMKQLNNGGPYETMFEITHNGVVVWSKPFSIPATEITATTNRPRLRQEVNRKIDTFKDTAQEWANYRDVLIYEVHLDNTEGVDERLAQHVRRLVEDFDLASTLDMGHGAEFWTFKLSDTFFLDDDRTVVKQGEGRAGLSKVNTKLDNLLAKSGGKENSSVATGIYKSLAKNQGKKNRTILVVTDGLENSDLANFYTNPPRGRKDAGEWNDEDQKLWEKLQSREKCPDLSGTRIYLRGPKSSKAADQTQRALKFWEAGLKKAGANIEMEY
jgi:hypothetical protein